MITHLRGELTSKSPEYIVIDVGGVGYGLNISLNTFSELPNEKEKVSLFTYTHSRDNAIELYGFSASKERTFFKLLISINKIGPKMARNILSKLRTDDLIKAIINENVTVINAIPGVGQKTAKRLIIELKDKISEIYRDEKIESDHDTSQDDALSALINLGYQKKVAENIIKEAIKKLGSEPYHLEDIIKKALELQAR